MKFKMAPNSLFAILLRNPWWISFLLAAVISLLAAALLPKELKIFGVLGTIPFWVTGLIALKRQWNQPSQAALEAEATRLAGLPWKDFASELEARLIKQGYAVERLKERDAKDKTSGAADFRLEKSGQITLLAAKRYKAASHGVEPLQALAALRQELGADHAAYFCLSDVSGLSEQAQAFAKNQGLRVGWLEFWQ
jgi:restriction system protein